MKKQTFTEQTRAVRLTGILDTISASKSSIRLRLKDNTEIPGNMVNHDPSSLKKLFGKQVLISGMGRFRPSGQLLSVDIEFIREATTGDEIFEPLPNTQQLTFPAVLTSPSSRSSQNKSSKFGPFFGTWPGEETDEELLKLLKEIR